MKIKYCSEQFTRAKFGADYRPVVISLDDHEQSIFMFALHHPSGTVLIEENVLGTKQDIAERLKKLEYGKKDMVVLMEAGGHGFSSYRYFRKLGYYCRLIAPTSIPRRTRQLKTDRRDAINNCEYYLSGALRYVHVPDEKIEDARECLRHRYQCGFAFTKQKQRILALMARQGKEYTLTESNWTQLHYRWLRRVELPLMARQVLDMMLDELERLAARVKELDTLLGELMSSDPKCQNLYQYYNMLPGIGELGAWTLILEGQDLSRFPNPAKLMTYTGLIPMKYASGQKDPHLSITKSGNKYLRLALVCAAKFYRDRRFMLSSHKLLAYPKEMQEFLERCQTRLHQRYRYLCKKGKHSNKAKVAVARELCAFLWELVVKVIPQIENKSNLVAA